MADKTIPACFDAGAIARSPAENAGDPTLSHARKIELLETLRDHHAAPANKGVLRDADRDKLLKLNSLAKDHR